MNHRVQLGENVVPVCLQEWGSEEGVPEEVFQFLTAGHWCRIYATGYHSVIPCFVQYRFYYKCWCAGLRPPTICAKVFLAYSA
jgi:hypothetical protein